MRRALLLSMAGLLMAASGTPLARRSAAQQMPVLDGKGRMLLEVVNTLERDLEELARKRRGVARRKEAGESELARTQEELSLVGRKLETTTARIEKILRSMVRMKEPDDLFLLFSTTKYHDLHVYRRQIRLITANLSERLAALVEKKRQLGRKEGGMTRELEALNFRREALLQEIEELHAVATRKKRELADRIAKIAAIESLFMTAGAAALDGAADDAGAKAAEVLAGASNLGDLRGKKQLQIPVSPGQVIKGFEKLPEAPYGTEKMVRGWILVPFVKGKKKDATDTAFVRVPSDGVVVFMGEVPGFGLTIIIDHAHEYHTVYANIRKTLVLKGDPVTKAQAIATIKSDRPGKELPYLYFEFREQRIAMNPKPWFKLRPITPQEQK